MISVLRHPAYRRLFTAQLVALAGTGLATVALALLAYDLAGAGAGVVLGTALAVKMVAYVTVAPLAGVLARRVPRRVLLVGADLVRAGVAVALPFVTEVWQVYLTVLLLQAASAVFTPAFQAVIPELLPEEREYTAALSLSRLAYDLEALVSPALAGALLTVVSFHGLFAGTAVGFLASAGLVLSVALPGAERVGESRRGRAVSGMRLFRATPRLRALLALDLAVAAAGAMVYVNTVVVVRDHFHHPAEAVTLALAAYGAGSMVTALLLPRVLGRLTDRVVMLPAAFGLPVALGGAAVTLRAGEGGWAWAALLVAWAAIGAAGSAVLTPGGRVLRRSAAEVDLPAAFAAQFSLSHACWLLTYPLAGRLAAGAGLPVAAGVSGVVALVGAVAAVRLWPAGDPEVLTHRHTDLPSGHPHLADAHPDETGYAHGHHYVIDRHHRSWPRPVQR